jgi:hypothetical protein
MVNKDYKKLVSNSSLQYTIISTEDLLMAIPATDYALT